MKKRVGVSVDTRTIAVLRRAARQCKVPFAEVVRAALFIYAANHKREERRLRDARQKGGRP